MHGSWRPKKPIRMAMGIGRTMGALLQQVWMILCFCIFVLLYTNTLRSGRILPLLAGFFLLLGAAVCFGTFLNTFALFSRDADIVMNFLEIPMSLFSGARMPISTFPVWGKCISLLFPLTYTLGTLRFILHMEGGSTDWKRDVMILLSISGILLITAKKVNHLAEKICRETGELSFY